MKKQLIKKVCSGLLSAAMVLAALPLSAPAHAAAVPKDARQHWAHKSIEKTIEAGIVAGYKDGSFRPDAPVTRAEFCHMINATLGNTATASINFRDVAANQWYYSDVSKAVAAGFVSGYSNGTFKPDQRITRQEAAVILSRVVPVSGSKISLSSYPDYSQIDTWARNSLSCAAGKKYITTYTDGKIHPKDNMSRGQAATIIANILSRETIIKTTPTISKDGDKLTGAIYSNGVTIDKRLDNGQATLSDSVILGNLDVSGGVLVTLDNCRVAMLMTRKTGDAVRVLAKNETSVHKTSATETATLDAGSVSAGSVFGNGFDTVNIARNAAITLRGNFSTVNVEGASSKTSLISGNIATLNVGSQAKGSDITIESTASVDQANVNAEAYFHGTGTISRMNANASGITYEKTPGSFGSGSGSTQPTSAELSISITPANGATKVHLDTSIKISFNRAVTLADGSSVARSDIEKIVELRRKTSSGTKVDYTASIDSAKKVITINPNSDLEEDTKYYVIIDKNEFRDSDKNKNKEFTASFTTGDDTSELISFTPKDKSTDVSISKALTIRFSEPVTDYEGDTLRDRDLDSVVTLRKTNSSGKRVDFSATIDSSKKVITVEPDSKLEEDTKYYLAINSKSLRTKSDKKAVDAASITFTTAGSSVSDYCTFYPKNKATDVSRSVKPTITFSEKMVRYDKKTITNDDLQDIVSFRNTTQNTSVPFTASINSGKTVITITPKSSLQEGCKFELGITSKSVRTAKDYSTVPAASVTWTATGTLLQTSLNAIANEDTITVSASGTKAGTIYAVLLSGSASTPSDTQIIAGNDASGKPALGSLSAAVTANTTKALGKFTDLSPKTSYKVCAVLKPTSGSNSAVATKTVTTSDRPGSTLSSLEVRCGGQTISVPLSSKTDYTAELPFGTTDVTISASTKGGNTSISGRGGSTGLKTETAQLPISLRGDEEEITIVSNKSGLYDTTYTLTLKVKGDTGLSSVSADGTRLSASGSRYSYEIPADVSSVIIEIEAADPNAFIDTDIGRRGAGSLSFSASGAQTIEITVDSNGDTKSYTLILTKKAAPEPEPEPTPSPAPETLE